MRGEAQELLWASDGCEPRRPTSDGRGRQGQCDRARNDRCQSAGRSSRWIPVTLAGGSSTTTCLGLISKALPKHANTSHCSTARPRGGHCSPGPPRNGSSNRLPARARAGVWGERFEDINTFEHHLNRNGNQVGAKFFLPRAPGNRREASPLDTPGREWKFNAADVDERARWDDYMAAFESALSRPPRHPGHRGTSSPLTTSGRLRRSLSRSSSTGSLEEPKVGEQERVSNVRLQRSSNSSPSRRPTPAPPGARRHPAGCSASPSSLLRHARNDRVRPLVASAYLSPSRAHTRQVPGREYPPYRG